MTEREFKRLEKYVGTLSAALGLGEWLIIVRREPPDNESWIASCWTAPGRRYALLRFCPNFNEFEPEARRATVVHELLHCVHHQTQDFVRDVLEDHLPRKQHALIRDVFFQHHECAIDLLSESIANLLPLPPE